jgi:glutamine synthetase
MESAGLIAPLVQRLREDFHLSPVTASEIEFYLPGSESYATLPDFWREVSEACRGAGISVFKTEKEKGADQHEIALSPCNDPFKTARDTQALRLLIASVAKPHGMTPDFSARPYAMQPGSGLHIHVHLMDERGRNVFYKDGERISEALKFSIGGLLATMKENMQVFAPSPESQARFSPGGMAPTTVSWGANNRTVAIRLPDSAHENKRIEHRVAGADADPGKVIAAILSGIHYGLSQKCEPGAQIYGDASLEQYGLPKLVELAS